MKNCFIAVIILYNLLYMFTNARRVPLVSDVRAPLYVDMDVTAINGDLQTYIEQEINDTYFENLNSSVTHLKSEVWNELSTKSQKYNADLSSFMEDLRVKLNKENEAFNVEMEDKFSKQKLTLEQNFITEMKDFKDEISKQKKRLEDDFSEQKLKLEQNVMAEMKDLKDEISKQKKQMNDKFYEQKSKLENNFMTEMKDVKDKLLKQKSEIAELKNKVIINEQQVAFTGCVNSGATRPSGYIIRFSSVKHHVGIQHLNNLTSSGKFTCEKEGLYQISTTITSYKSGAYYYIYKNGVRVAERYMDFSSGAYSTTAIITLELTVSDKVWVQTGQSMYVYGRWSCFTVIKVK